MPSNSNTPHTRNTRSNSQSDINLDSIKTLLQATKNEIIDSIKDEIQALKNIITSLSSRVDKLEEDNKLLMTRYEELKTENSDAPNGLDNKCSEVIEEVRQRDVRKRNVIMIGLPEESTGSVAERSKRDENKCKEIFETLGVTNNGIKSVIRLGKKREDNRRVLRVTLNNEEDKYELMRHSRHLRDTVKFHDVFIKPDLTPLQRKIDFELRRDLRTFRMAQPEKDFVVFKGKVMERKDIQNFRYKF